MLCQLGVPEVLRGLGNSLAVEADDDAAELLITVGDVEVDLWTLLVMRWSGSRAKAIESRQ
jgi:hypothetical protein